jgi:hypothetical protein
LFGNKLGIDKGAEEGTPLGIKVNIDEGPEDAFDNHGRYDQR